MWGASIVILELCISILCSGIFTVIYCTSKRVRVQFLNSFNLIFQHNEIQLFVVFYKPVVRVCVVHVITPPQVLSGLTEIKHTPDTRVFKSDLNPCEPDLRAGYYWYFAERRWKYSHINYRIRATLKSGGGCTEQQAVMSRKWKSNKVNNNLTGWQRSFV